MTPAQTKAVAESFPALRKLGFLEGKKAVPFIQQLEWTDCGAASLCMVMAYHGRETKLAEVREAMGIGRDGVSAKAILDTAEHYGLAGRGIKVDVSQLKLAEDGHDPALGVQPLRRLRSLRQRRRPHRRPGDRPARRAARASSRKAFTGVAIELTPTTALHEDEGRRRAASSATSTS